jgi:hypothetical protein
MWGILYDESVGLSSTIAAAGPHQLSLGLSPARLMNIVQCIRFKTPPTLRARAPYPVFISLRKRVAQLYPRALGSLFLTSYDSLGYGVYIRTCLHTGVVCEQFSLHVFNGNVHLLY